jgi:hypothetical protein
LKRLLIAAAAYAAITACSSTNVCQQTLTLPALGDCHDLALDSGILAQLTISPAQRTACETACTSNSDQTAVTNLITCLNYIPADAGACSLDAGQNAWLTRVAAQALVCANTNMPSTGCYNAVTGQPDAG